MLSGFRVSGLRIRAGDCRKSPRLFVASRPLESSAFKAPLISNDSSSIGNSNSLAIASVTVMLTPIKGKGTSSSNMAGGGAFAYEGNLAPLSIPL